MSFSAFVETYDRFSSMDLIARNVCFIYKAVQEMLTAQATKASNCHEAVIDS